MLIEKNDTEHKNRKALVLAGGGIRVAYQVGILKAMEENGLTFNLVDGTSGGIFNAAMLASGHAVDKMIDKWKSLPIKYFASLARFSDYLTPWKLKGLGDADNIQRKVLPHFEVEVDRINKLDLPISFSLCNFSNKTVQAIPAREVKEKHLLAGVSLPILMPALQVGKDWFIDAVWVKDANLMEAVRRGAEEIWLIWGIGNYPSYFSGALHQYVHSIEMSANGALWEEFEQIKLINRAIEKGYSEFGQQQKIKVFIIKPNFPLPLDPELFLRKITSRDLINMGYQDAKRYLLTNQNTGEKLDKQATQTRDAGDYLAIRLQYTGNLLFKDKLEKVKYYVLLRFSVLESLEQLEVYSSVYLGYYNKEFLGGKHEVSVKSLGAFFNLETTSTLTIEGREYTMIANIHCKGPWYCLAGLDFKTAEIILYPRHEADPKVLMEGRLYQSLGSRLNAGWNALAKKKNGARGGIRFKFNLIKNMLQHEV
ncbi:patatin-like phospholipase family protein [Cyclobacterium plantarum]|uniref:Patatin-like phospholipase family protein n=1 Tax=Cyclobacterium plantarum TaxID=2716263 RepID=A0ABX0HC56_9BACT|nr:patatin-like phospholipase family protein [Cyclobacterium plantarum]NHE57545.1 patatin-like phospholipase family protein [Cyclobacterium plantarum]